MGLGAIVKMPFFFFGLLISSIALFTLFEHFVCIYLDLFNT